MVQLFCFGKQCFTLVSYISFIHKLTSEYFTFRGGVKGVTVFLYSKATDF